MTTFDSPPNRIRYLLSGMEQIDVPGQLVRTAKLGEDLDFSGIEPLFLDFQRQSARLSQVSWDSMPQSVQERVLATVTAVNNAHFEIAQFKAEEGMEKRDRLAEEYRQRLDDFKDYALPYAAYLLWDTNSAEERTQALVQEIEGSLASARATQEDIESKRADVDSVLELARGASAQQGVSQQAAIFQKAAERYEKVSTRWLKWSVASGLLTVLVAILLVVVWKLDGTIEQASNLQIVLAKAAALAILSYATITAVRLYRSNAHLAAVNRHRQDALTTFEKFVEGSSATDVRDKVLLAAAHAAFGQTPTGLIGDKADGGNTVEVLDGIAGGLIRRP